MIGVWVNFAGVAVGGLIGTLLRGGISKKYQVSINRVLALCVLVIGVSGAIKTANVLIVIVSAVVGTALGEWIRVERGLEKLGDWAQARFSKGEAGFADGFVNATLLFSVGAMAVVGSLEAGLSNRPDTLLAKAVIDTVTAIIFASTFGAGVILSAVPLTIYQGGIAALAGVLAPLLTDSLVNEMSAVGSLIIIGLSVNMLGLTKERLRVGNMLPAMLVPVAYFPIAALIEKIF